MWRIAVVFLALSDIILGASVFYCPEGTICHEQGVIESSSFKFLDKLGPKHYRSITKLTVSNASLDKVPPEIKYLKHLEYLDLSNNNIQISSIPSLPNLKVLKLNNNNLKSVALATLPKNIEELDLSNNLLSHIPKDCNSLKQLKILHLYKNLIDCDCYNANVLTYNKLIRDGIRIPEPVMCHLPKHFADKIINSINCTLSDIMVYDEPEEGSGSGDDIFSENIVGTQIQDLQEEKDKVEENEIIDDKDDLPKDDDNMMVASHNDISSTIEPEEGSGDLEGSGFVPLGPVEIPDIPACHINCSTPEPIGSHDDEDASPLPGPSDQLQIIAEDVLHPLFGKPSDSTSTSTTESTVASTTSQPEVIEEVIVKESSPVVLESDKPNNEVEVFSNNTNIGEMEKATLVNQNNYAVYAVVACGLLLAIVFGICLVKKRKAKRIAKNRREANGFGEEMKPLEKPTIQPVNEKNGKTPNNIPEHIPLINGQNGKPKDEPVLKSYTPLAHPEVTPENNYEDPELRQKPELLTPPRERVTIRASEIPDSIPKTPVLVHRQKNSEGEIVTTVLPP